MALSRRSVARGHPTRGAGRSLGDTFFRLGSGATGVAVLVLLGAVTAILVVDSQASLRTFGLGFLGGATWDPNAGAFGALPFVYGTLVTAALALLLGVPVSLGIAIFVSELAPSWLRTPLTYLVELLAAVPSVVYGLWGIFVLIPLMAHTVEPALQSLFGWSAAFQGPIYGYGMLTAGVILAIMIIPTVSAVSREALLAVPQSQREAALGVGATRWETTRIAVLPYARSGIFGAIILGLGRAVGETMAVTMVIGNRNAISASLFAPGQTLASWIANNVREASGLELSAIVELGLVLLLVTLLINVFARLMVWRVLGKRGAVAA